MKQIPCHVLDHAHVDLQVNAYQLLHAHPHQFQIEVEGVERAKLELEPWRRDLSNPLVIEVCHSLRTAEFLFVSGFALTLAVSACRIACD